MNEPNYDEALIIETLKKFRQAMRDHQPNVREIIFDDEGKAYYKELAKKE